MFLLLFFLLIACMKTIHICLASFTLLYFHLFTFSQGTYFKSTHLSNSNTHSTSVTTAWSDVDNNGYEDLFIGNYHKGQNAFYLNYGPKGFIKQENSIITDDRENTNDALWMDYNNDGLEDLFICNYKAANTFYQNLGNGNFKMHTFEGFENDENESWSAISFDYNGDGFLDIYVVHSGKNELFENINGTSFKKIDNHILTNDTYNSYTATIGDYNNDGKADIYIGNFGNQKNQLFKNIGKGYFEEITVGSIVNDKGNSRSCTFGDYNNDGLLDLFVANSGQKNCLYRNEGGNSFSKIENTSLTEDSSWSYCAVWDDYNNDGYLDMILTHSTTSNKVTLYENDNGNGFKTSQNAIKVENAFSVHHSLTDMDNDGKTDLFVCSKGVTPNYLFTNIFSTPHKFLGFLLEGTESNRNAIGASIAIHTDKSIYKRHITGKQGQKVAIHISEKDVIKNIIITWPNGTKQIVKSFGLNEYHKITEKRAFALKNDK